MAAEEDVDAVDDLGDPWTEFALTIFKLNGLIMLAGEDISRLVGQTSARWQVLGRVAQPRTVAAIAREVGYARQSVQRVADILASEGLVRYRQHPTDRRTKLVELTPSGRKVVTALYRRQLAWSSQVLAVLDPAKLRETTTSLQTVGAALEEVAEAASPEGPQQAQDPPRKKSNRRGSKGRK